MYFDFKSATFIVEQVLIKLLYINKDAIKNSWLRLYYAIHHSNICFYEMSLAILPIRDVFLLSSQ